MGGVRECGRDLFGWVERVRARIMTEGIAGDIGAPALACQRYRSWRNRRGLYHWTTEPLRVCSAWYGGSSDPCSGSSDLAPLFGLVGGPAARALPLPALADVRTVTWPVGW